MFTFHLEPQAQAAQVTDVPAASWLPERYMHVAEEQESLPEQLEGMNRSVEEAEANVKIQGISLTQAETKPCRAGTGPASEEPRRRPTPSLGSWPDVGSDS